MRISWFPTPRVYSEFCSPSGVTLTTYDDVGLAEGGGGECTNDGDWDGAGADAKLQLEMVLDQYIVPKLALVGTLASNKVKRLLNQGEASQKVAPGDTYEQTATEAVVDPWQLLTIVAIGSTATPPPRMVMLIEGGKSDSKAVFAPSMSRSVAPLARLIMLQALGAGSPLSRL